MKLCEFIAKHKLPDTTALNSIPLKHPKTKEKIYIHSRWSSGFWYRKIPHTVVGPVYPCEYRNDLNDLKIYGYARKEIKEFIRMTTGVS